MYDDKRNTIALIKKYRNLVDGSMDLLLDSAKSFDYYQETRKGTISAKGWGDVHFEFHGIGCLLITKEYVVDFDYAYDNGRFDIIDIFFLKKFYDSGFKSQKTSWDRIKKIIEALVEDGYLIPLKFYNNRFYLKDDFENPNPKIFNGWDKPLSYSSF